MHKNPLLNSKAKAGSDEIQEMDMDQTITLGMLLNYAS